MNVLIVYAHPEPQSLNGSLKDFTVQRLQAAGHQVQVSDLYAMQWKATLDAHDTLDPQPAPPFNPSLASRHALEHGLQAPDIVAEQDKLRWADAVILQFPLWWFSMPAILKGWVERVYAYGFAYGVGEHSDQHWGDRYGEGLMAGKRAMLVVTTGGWEPHYSARGINGPISDLLFPIHHGVLHYPGFDVLPPYVAYHTCQVNVGQRLDSLWTTPPIAFRRQNGGDYDIPELTLRRDILPGVTGFNVHVGAHDEQGDAQPA